MRILMCSAFFAALLVPSSVRPQCANDNTLLATVTPTCPGTSTASSCIMGGQYVLVNVVAGNTYTFSTCTGTAWDSQITLYNNTGGLALGYNDDDCGLQSTVTWFATFSGQLRVLVDQYNCVNNGLCGTLTINCSTTAGSPCTATNIPSLPVTGQSVLCAGSNLISSANVSSFCGTASALYLGGNEALYTVTPTVTGSYAINYAGQTWSSIWVFSGACPAAGGICQGSVSSSTATQSLTVSMTAGVPYWILFDTWPTPASPCPGSFSISNVPPPVVASDCNQSVNVCTNINFQIDPNGFGSTYEIPALGSLGNPDLWGGDFIMSPWGTDNWGCLRAGELNSTWMVVNVLTGGSLQFTFGGLGTQTGFYDWVMYPFNVGSCAQVAANLQAPVRCNWNGVAFGGTGLAAPPPAGGDPTNYETPMIAPANSRWLICFSNWSSVTTAVPLQFGGTAVVSCSPLPVELLAFDAMAMGRSVSLEWMTGSESNSSRFIVERSADALDWIELEVVAAAGESQSPLLYRTMDPVPPMGTSFYRLRMIDADGSFALSETRSVTIGSELLVVPNPSRGLFTVHDVPEDADLLFLDATGRTTPVRMRRTEARTVTVETPGLMPGIYSLLVNDQGQRSVARVSIEH